VGTTLLGAIDMPVPFSAAVAVLVVGALAALPSGAAAAPTLQADRPCYTPGQPMVLTGGGYTPGGQVVFLAALAGDRGRSDALPLGSPFAAGPAGALNARVAAPDLATERDLRETLTITASDQVRAGAQPPLPPAEQSGTVTVTLSTFGLGVRAWIDGTGDPRASTDLVAVGWEPFRRLYAHYFLRGRRVRSLRIGALGGPCGDLRARVRQFPFRPVRAGTWTVYFSPTQRFDRRGVWIRARVAVARGA
jgi:hypothetical protein